MNLLELITITDTEFTASNVTEDDHDEWDAGDTYVKGERVIVTGTTHKVYESIGATPAGNDPTDEASAFWLEVGATNRWKAFDQSLADQTTRAGAITYSLTMSSMATGIAFFNLNAGRIRVRVSDTEDTEIYDQSLDLNDTTEVIDWFSFFFGGVEYDTEALFVGVPLYTGFQVDITIDADSGDAQVGQIVIGPVQNLGTTISGTEIGFEDFSIKDRDDFGRAVIVERPFIDETDFRFVYPTDDARRVKRVLTRNRARPGVYFPDADGVRFGATVFGLLQDFSAPLESGGTSVATVEVEGLT